MRQASLEGVSHQSERSKAWAWHRLMKGYLNAQKIVSSKWYTGFVHGIRFEHSTVLNRTKMIIFEMRVRELSVAIVQFDQIVIRFLTKSICNVDLVLMQSHGIADACPTTVHACI
jgi:hypothetical protein